MAEISKRFRFPFAPAGRLTHLNAVAPHMANNRIWRIIGTLKGLQGKNRPMRGMGLTTFLLGAVLVGSALQAARAEYWELARLEPDLSLLSSGKKRPVPPGIVTANLESDASPQWLRYDNPGDTSGHISARPCSRKRRVRRSAPAANNCSCAA
jgi:hypothetical protein